MICYPNAKINLGLNVIEKRSDGYHNLETVFYPIPLADILEIVENKNACISASYSGIKIEGNETDNLCIVAYNLLAADYKLPTIKFHLHKTIPMGAGLGGGSADAAFFLDMLNKMFQLKIKEEQLIKYASFLGSDCAFFIKNKPCFAKSRGEELYDLELNLKNYFFVLINPAIHVSTKDAFAMLKPKTPKASIIEIIKQPIKDWKDNLKNDFEESVFQKFPKIETIKNELYTNGALYASMSGSGSSVYGIFKSEVNLKNIFPNYFYYSVWL